MASVEELKKELKKAQAKVNEKNKIQQIAQTISKEDLLNLRISEDRWSEGHSETIRFTLEIDMEVSASPENDCNSANLHHVEMKLVSSSGIPKHLATEMVSSLSYMQHDDSNFSWAENLAQAKPILKTAQKKIDEYVKTVDDMAKKYGTTRENLNDALYEIRHSKKR